MQGSRKTTTKPTTGITRLSVENSDISEEETDVIVNTTTEEMKLNNSAVSKALLDKAGDILQRTCDQLIESGLRLDEGKTVATKAYGSLKCKKIIHAHVPPRADAIQSGIDHKSLIAEIVTKCLGKAETMGMKTISFPAFGFGQGGYSLYEVAEPMLTAFQDFGRQGPKEIEAIRVVIYDEKLHKQFFDFFVSFFQINMSAPRKLASALASKLNSKGSHSEWYVELQDSAYIASQQQSHADIQAVKNKILQFHIYASSDDTCSSIAEELNQFVKKKCIMEEIEDPVLANLLVADIADIQSTGASLQVQVNVMPQEMKIKIQGVKAKEARSKIMEVVNEMKLLAELHHWQSKSGDDIKPYSDEDNFKLERAKAKNISLLHMYIESSKVIIDLNKMEEQNISTGDTRKVTRVPIRPSCKLLFPILYCITTVMLEIIFLLTHAVNLPDTWAPQDGKASGMHMFDVPEGSQEYQDALLRFRETINQPAAVTIISLKRVQNPNLYQLHSALENAIYNKYSKEKVDVRQLFHGSKEDSIKYIATQGFNRSLAADSNGGCIKLSEI